MSEQDTLKLLITFIKKQYDPKYVIKYASVFLSEFRDNLSNGNYDYEFKFSNERNVDLDYVYKVDLYEVEASLKLRTPQSYSTLFAQIIQDWCNPQKNKLSNLWLQIANPSILENDGKLCHTDVDINKIAFGTLPDMHYFMQHYHYQANSGKKEISCSFLHSQRKLIIYTCFSHSISCDLFAKPVHNKFEFFYEAISRVIVNYVPNSDFIQIFFQLHHTPLIYYKKTNKEKNQENSTRDVLESDQDYQAQTWERTIDFGCTCKNYFCPVEKIGRCSILKVAIHKKLKTFNIIKRIIQRCSSDTSFYFTYLKTVGQKFLQCFKDFDWFPFNYGISSFFSNKYLVDDINFKLQFAWEVLNSRSLEVRDQLALKYELNPTQLHWEHLKQKLESFLKIQANSFNNSEIVRIIERKTEALAKTFYDISDMISKNLLFKFEDALKVLFKYHLMSECDEEVPEGMCIVRRIVLTPSKIICLPPAEHFDNRVIRKFCMDNFVRVSIQDDNFQKLTYAVQYNSKREAILERVVKRMLNGIRICSRQYELLAASNSQLREHGVWMYSKDMYENTAAKIRFWMGNFKDIKNVAKYMARMGQCFSTSDEAVQVQLDSSQVIQIPDIICEKKGVIYKFTDGVGMMSKELVKEVQIAYARRHYPATVGMYDPSAFQIRFGGCKGMLAEAHPSYLSSRKIAIRPSMNKFPCPSSNALEIVKISAPRAVYLNRPLITILENLGVKKNVFINLQKKMVFDLTDSLIYDKKACKLFKNCTTLPFPFMKLSKSGISLTQEPFFRSLLLCVYKSMISMLFSLYKILLCI